LSYKFRMFDQSKALEVAVRFLADVKREQVSPFLTEFGEWKSYNEEELKNELMGCLITPGTRQKFLEEFWKSEDFKKLASANQEQLQNILFKHKIRFARRKAESLGKVRTLKVKPFLEKLAPYTGKDLPSERIARLHFMKYMSVGGFKVTSLFFKTIGFTKFLAVLDVRNLNFMKKCRLLPSNIHPQTLTQQNVYYVLESWENLLAEKLNVTLPELDTMICKLMERV